MKRNLLKIRPFNIGGAFEIRLPQGKIILIVPCFTYYLADRSIHHEFEGGYTRENVEGADYIFLTHSHWDHDMDIGYFVKRYHSKVFCSAMCAEELLKYHDLCYDDIFPVFPEKQYTLEDFSFQAFQGKHNAMQAENLRRIVRSPPRSA